MQLTYRRAGPQDAAHVRALINAAYAKWTAVIGYKPRPMLADYDHAVRAHLVEFAIVDGASVALIQLIPAGDHLVLENIAVDPAHQGKGIGDALMERVDWHARQLGFPLIRLLTNQRFASNIAFYQRRGYTIERAEELSDRVLVHMTKAL